MRKTLLFAGRVVTLALGCSLVAATTRASLSRPPSSHTEITADGLHVLVFLARIQPVEDGYVTQEEHDRTVRLNSMYPASGCYVIGSTTPLWTAPWDDRDYWIVSNDNRFLVRLNIYGDGEYNSRSVGEGELSWGLKFYDRGRELKSYDVAELLDYPSLMPFTSADWHYQWFGNGADSFVIQSGQFVFETSTHDYYRFDLATGAIVQEFRLWRTMARAAFVMFAVSLVGVTVLAVRKRKDATAIQQTADGLKELSRYYPPLSARRYHYSLRTLLVVTTAIAVLCLAVPRWPHIVLLLSAVLIAVAFTRTALRYLRASQFARNSGRRRAGFALRVVAAGLAWGCCYVLSMAPAQSFMFWLRAPEDVRMAVILTVYRPVVWILGYVSPDVFSPLEWYFRAWGVS